MPIYEYKCTNGHQFEVMQRMSDDAVTACEVCDATVQRVFHPIAVHFKGSGFYNTDYGTRRRSREGAETNESKGSDGGSSDSTGLERLEDRLERLEDRLDQGRPSEVRLRQYRIVDSRRRNEGLAPFQPGHPGPFRVSVPERWVAKQPGATAADPGWRSRSGPVHLSAPHRAPCRRAAGLRCPRRTPGATLFDHLVVVVRVAARPTCRPVASAVLPAGSVVDMAVAIRTPEPSGNPWLGEDLLDRRGRFFGQSQHVRISFDDLRAFACDYPLIERDKHRLPTFSRADRLDRAERD